MATLPTDTQISTVLKADQTWLQKHERLLIVFMVLLVGGFLFNKHLDNSAVEAQTAYGIAQKASAAAASQAALDASAYRLTLDVMSRQIDALQASQTQRNASLAQKQTQTKTEPLPQVALDWQGLIGGQGDILSDTTGFSITNDAARRTVAQLESVPVLQGNLADETKIAQAMGQELDKANALVLGLNVEITKDAATCKADVAAVKAVSRRSKRDWFIIGFAAGIATRILGKF